MFRLWPELAEELTTEENVGRKGEADDEVRERLAGSGLRSVDKGVRPRAAPAEELGSPQADCCVLKGLRAELLLVLEATEF